MTLVSMRTFGLLGIQLNSGPTPIRVRAHICRHTLAKL
jgi:hypothetical protein